MHLTVALILPVLLIISVLPPCLAWTTTIILKWQLPDTHAQSSLSIVAGFCTAVPPGRCCASRLGIRATQGSFVDLPDGAIGAFWQAPAPSGNDGGGHFEGIACDGRLMDTYVGRPRWTYQAPPNDAIAGASYIQCPRRTASTAGSAGIGWLGVLLGFCTKGNRKRGTISGASIQPTWTYPDIMQVNGTSYTNQMGGLVYKEKGGRVLDLMSLN